MENIFLSLIILITFIFISRKKDFRSVIKLFSIMSLIVLVYYSFFQEDYVPFSKKFDIFYSVFLFLFFIPYLLFLFFYKYVLKYVFVGGIKPVVKKHPVVILYTWKIYYIICVLFALYSIISFCYLFMITGGVSLLRELISQSEGSMHVGASFPLCCSMLFYMREKEITKGRKFMIVLIIILAIISTSKQFLLLTFLFLVPWYKKGFKLKITLILPIILIGLLGFMLIHILVGHISLSSINTLSEIVLKQFNSYFIGPLASFQLYLDGLWKGATTGMEGWVKAGNYIGNTHTAFKKYYDDMNFLSFSFYILAIAYIYSFIHSKNTLFHNFMKVFAVFPLYMLFFADLMFQSMWFSFGLAGLGISFIGDNKVNEKYLFTYNNIQA
jgi:hypothetical protein